MLVELDTNKAGAGYVISLHPQGKKPYVIAYIDDKHFGEAKELARLEASRRECPLIDKVEHRK